MSYATRKSPGNAALIGTFLAAEAASQPSTAPRSLGPGAQR